ncbi:MAG: TIGR01777 family protein [Myxococcales bacterium]|nr:TIGR01777 family protein [Myxococcales bacterium]
MPVFVARSPIDASAEELFDWHARPAAFERLALPWSEPRLVAREGSIRDGDRLVLELRLGPLRRRWVAVHRNFEPGRGFVDEQQSGPFASWVHTHRFTPAGPERAILEDRIEYELPFGPAGAWLRGNSQRFLQRMFRFRHERTRNDLARHRHFAGRERLRVAITGASGLVGRALTAFLLTGGHRVDRVLRRQPEAGTTDLRWDPAAGELDPAPLEGVDAVVHLAGERIDAGRWTRARRERILQSRSEGTRLLCERLAGLSRKPRVLVSASAIGFYGDRGAEALDENSVAGAGFLAGVCRDWEDATEPAAAAGIRVVRLRLGIVVAGAGGALARMLPLARLGLGGPIGSGQQWMSWIAIDDLIGAVHQLLYSDEVSGAVNAVAPAPLPNRDFARVLGHVLGRPAFLPVPAFVLRTAFGRLADEALLASARVDGARLRESGFEFLYPNLEAALRSELGAGRRSDPGSASDA